MLIFGGLVLEQLAGCVPASLGLGVLIVGYLAGAGVWCAMLAVVWAHWRALC